MPNNVPDEVTESSQLVDDLLGRASQHVSEAQMHAVRAMQLASDAQVYALRAQRSARRARHSKAAAMLFAVLALLALVVLSPWD